MFLPPGLDQHTYAIYVNGNLLAISCDACRANKTKCSGGPPCSLCRRRGIDCTLRNCLRQSRGVPTSDGSAAANASVSEDDDDVDISTSPTCLRPENFPAEHVLHPEGEHLPPNLEFLKNVTVVSSEPRTTGEFRPLSRGMEGIYELLVAEKPSLEGAMEGSDGLQEFVTKYLETYFKRFHLRWPTLHAPVFSLDISTMPLHLSASIDPELIPEGQAWPIELFQAVILTLIFSLYRTDKTALSRAMLLRSTFITFLRELGAFDAEILASHLKTHYSGTFAPYTLSMREHLTRLLALTYQFDVYFALAHEKPPILHRQEVDVGLPNTFALWNSYGIDVFDARQPEEPLGRIEFRISEMTNRPDSFTSSQLLVEDVQLGLCGLLQAIWVFRQSSSSSKTERHPSSALQNALLIEILDDWKLELDKINKLANARSMTSNATRTLLLAYRGADSSVAASLEKINTLVQDGMILYYYLKMYHNAGLVKTQTEEPHTDETLWTLNKYGRKALVCALQILKLVESIGAWKACLNPLIRHALAMGLNVTKTALVSGQKRECECLTNDGQHADVNLQQWTEIGGPIWIDGTPVCLCTLNFWTKSFEEAMQDLNIMEG
ncbi:hypothetical protein UA08_00073 [Talaromyces atroroseus]|uniref:Zn(2)-C6 fungal-type domain-containing protein n=1 Tax=Talaromyces atroroseus TaxID=1441469 RepID=A0A225B8D2_TALAT|nr:hypothetical protein UA08_00073 [Talaromyces atroroseus]OKL63656.1 hypothetical protein UA08_00073 [Talaromyces atroroseus]